MTNGVALQYFEDKLGIIYYQTTAAPASPGIIECIAVYVPSGSLADAVSVNVETGRLYAKTAYQGRRHEREELPDLPVLPKYKLWLTRNTSMTLSGGLLALPEEYVQRWYDPFDSLDRALQNPTSIALDVRDGAMARAAVERLGDLDVPRSAIAANGSMQCGMRHLNGRIGDIDLVVVGLQYRDSVRRAAVGNEVRVSKIQSWHRANHYRFRNAIRRGEIAQFHVGDSDPTQVDVRVIAREAESVNTSAHNLAPGREVAGIGQVVDDSEGLSFPPTYIVKDEKSQQVAVVTSPYYQFVGCVQRGDRVIFRGSEVACGWLVLGDTPRHHLCQYAESDSEAKGGSGLFRNQSHS